MTSKFLEIRDSNTFIPALGISISSIDGYLARRAGFGQTRCIYLVMLETQRCAYDPYDWPASARTMAVAHQHIEANWDILNSGDVVDVEWILGETKQPKVSERESYP